MSKKTKFYKWRKKMGYTQQEIGDLTNLPQSTISRIEDGAFVPTPKKRIQMSRDLGVKIADLFDYLEVRKIDLKTRKEGESEYDGSGDD